MEKIRSAALSSLLTLISFLLLTAPACFANQVVFSQDVSIGWWHVRMLHQKISFDDTDAGSIYIRKITPEKRIGGGFVILNSQLIWLNDFFKGDGLEFQKAVKFKNKINMTIFLHGTPGAALHLEIRVKGTQPPPKISFTGSPQSVSLGEASTLEWNTTNAETCLIDKGIGTVEVNGSKTVAPGETTTYVLTAEGPGGVATAEARVAVTYPPPGVTLTADSQTVELGDLTTLTWNSNHAASCEITPNIGQVALNGSLTVTPEKTEIYTITASSPGGTAANSVIVTVRDPSAPPEIEVTASAEKIEQGGEVVLSWTTYNAQSVHIDNGIGSVDPSGGILLTPEYSTLYTLTATGLTGSSSAKILVRVLGSLPPQPEGSFGERYEDLIPEDVTVNDYDPKRLALITGLVKEINETPLDDVLITIQGHPEYGSARTGPRGRFSIPVLGGSAAMLEYRKAGYISAHRKVTTYWNDISVADKVVMIIEDPFSTTVTFDGNPDTVVTHQSSTVTDEFGSRSASLVFQGDNRAYLVDENGNDVQELATIVTRATEYATPDSMPAILPPTSAYTYCVELSVDGAARVRFEKPVTLWVDNFLGFDVGVAAPVGYYDRDKGVWIPEKNGRVVQLLDINADSIVDALDADGDGLPDDTNANGTFTDEVSGLENPLVYQPGATFWKVNLSHFSPYDINWPGLIVKRYSPPTPHLPDDNIMPNPEAGIDVNEPVDEDLDCQTGVGSYVDDRSQVYHDDIFIPGTGLSLHYSSNRVAGYRYGISIPASGSMVPESLKRIVVRLEIAGRIFEQELEPIANQRAEFVWDGNDYTGGTPLRGLQWGKISIGFGYDGVYTIPPNVERAFAMVGRDLTSILTRTELFKWRYSITDLKLPPINTADGTLAEGWTISLQHHLDKKDPSILYKGDGSLTKNELRFVENFAGNGSRGYSGDGGSASSARLNSPVDLELDPEGNIFILELENEIIRKVDQNGIITTIGEDWAVDLDNKVDSPLSFPYGFTLNEKGELYVADSGNCVIRRIDTNGNLSTIAGNGLCGYSGDGGAALLAELNFPMDLDVDNLGNIYISDSANHVVRKIHPDGNIMTVAGNGSPGFSGDGGFATEAQLFFPQDVKIDKYGNIFIADTENGAIRMVDPSGIIKTVAGTGVPGYSGDGGPATEAQLYSPSKLTLDIDDSIYISDQYINIIRKVDPLGTITAFVDTDGIGPSEGTIYLPQTEMNYPGAILFDQSGILYIADTATNRVRSVVPAWKYRKDAGFSENIFPDDNGLGYVMSGSGRHLSTFDLETGTDIYTFGYSSLNYLISVTDRFGNVTTIDWEGERPVAVISPDGLMTRLNIDPETNHLVQVTYPDETDFQFEYIPTGLQTSKIDRRGNRFDHEYTALGRLESSFDEEGGYWQFKRSLSDAGALTEITTAEGNLSSYLDFTDSEGAFNSIMTGPTGFETFFTRAADGLTESKLLPCGMTFESRYSTDPHFQFKYLARTRARTESGLEHVVTYGREYRDEDNDSVPDMITYSSNRNGNVTVIENNLPQSTKTVTSAEGRRIISHYNPTTLVSERVEVPGLYDTLYSYDVRGRLVMKQVDTRITRFEHNQQGFVESVTDPLGHQVYYGYDNIGRVTNVTRPDGSFIDFSYDANGNMTTLTNPSGIDHEFGHNRVNHNTFYKTPLSGSYSLVYDRDHRLIETNFPSGRRINNVYENGRLIQVQTPEGNIDYTYLCSTKVGSVTKGSESISYSYDAKLVTAITYAGSLNKTLEYTYNSDFNPVFFSYADGAVGYAYDRDGLLIGAGDFNISRHLGNGLPETVTDGNYTLDCTFNGYGEVDSKHLRVGSKSINTWDVVRDANGRIIHKTEISESDTSEYAYAYDANGRLLSVTTDAVLVEEYRYDTAGRRSYEMNARRDIPGRSYTYSDGDHLLAVAGIGYEYDVDGFLTRKIDDDNVTEYSYSARGELLSVVLPDNSLVEYINDPLGRRIAKKINGTVTEKYLWHGLTRLLAVYDGADNLQMRFEYADDRVPAVALIGSVRYYLGYDQVGSLRVVADTSGNVVKTIEYDSFGNVVNDSNPDFAIQFGFAGGLFDVDTGLVRFGYRDYDPEVGRWTAKDPILFAGEDTDLYGYVLNDPISFIDRYGLVRWGQVGTGTASFVVGGMTLVAGGAVTGIGVAEFSTIPVSGPVGLLMGIHTVGVGGTLMATGGGLAWFGLTNIWDGLFNDSDSCKDF